MKHAYTIIADLHTHTLFSGHAHSTFSEMVGAARDKGLYALAVTDHTGVMPGSPVDWYFSSLHELPLHYKGVLTIVGAETNILDFEGNTDLGESYAGQLDWVVASIHRLGLPGLENPDVEKCTHLWSQIAKNPRVNIIAHSGDGELRMSPDMREAVDVFTTFMYEGVYYNPIAKGEERKVQNILGSIWEYYVNHIDELPVVYQSIADDEGPQRAVCDYVSGMTDSYALEVYSELFIPAAWTIK